MALWEKVRASLSKGLESSKELFMKAKDKAQDLSEVGVLKFELMQLENQAEKLFGALGTKIFEIYQKDSTAAIKADNPDINEMLNQISDIEDQIKEKEEKIKDHR